MMEIFIGDFVFLGGELFVVVLVDLIGCLLLGVLNDEILVLFDFFQDNLLVLFVYMCLDEFRGWKVLDIFKFGNFKKIEEWWMDKVVECICICCLDLLKGEEQGLLKNDRGSGKYCFL